jgi:cytosine permease
MSQLSGIAINPLYIGVPLSLAIAVTTARGAVGLEKIGVVLLPITLCVLLLSVGLVFRHLHIAFGLEGRGELSFSKSVSAVVGIYIVGIVIQPDYGRFVRRPIGAALGAGLALGVSFPLVMVVSSLASLATGAPNLISAMIGLGFGLPALAVLVLGSWIDASASLYSASLSFANQLPRATFVGVVAGGWLIGLVLVLIGADEAFVPFLITLGVALPPLATVLVLSHFIPQREGEPRTAVFAIACWMLGTIAGLITTSHIIAVTRLPVLDSVLAAATSYLLLKNVQNVTNR